MPTLVEKWMEKGIAQGREQGREQGIKKNARESVVELLEIRFGNRPSQILTWLNQLTDVPTLKGILRQAATAASIREFEQFLEATMQSSSGKTSDDKQG